jgi:hypothetical protein
MNDYWQKWYKANELEREKIIETLNIQDHYIHIGWWELFIPNRIKQIRELRKYAIANIVNSYLTDLAEFMEDNKEDKR